MGDYTGSLPDRVLESSGSDCNRGCYHCLEQLCDTLAQTWYDKLTEAMEEIIQHGPIDVKSAGIELGIVWDEAIQEIYQPADGYVMELDEAVPEQTMELWVREIEQI